MVKRGEMQQRIARAKAELIKKLGRSYAGDGVKEDGKKE